MATTSSRCPKVFSLALQQLRLDTEEIIIGACLIDKYAYPRVMDILLPQTFVGNTVAETTHGTRIAHSDVWQAIRYTYNCEPIDLLTVTKTLISRLGNCPQIGAIISEMTDRICSSENIEVHAIMLIELSIREAAINLTESWIDDTAGQKSSDMKGLSQRLRDCSSDILTDIELGIKFLSENGCPDESDELRELLGTIAKRILHLKERQIRKHIIKQYHHLNRKDNDQND